MKSKAIELKDVWKTYKMGKIQIHAINEVNLTIYKGEFIVITGTSGSGKSTMMHLIGCLDIPSQGSVFLEDKNIRSLSKSQIAKIRGKKIGFIFQQFNLLPTLSALHNVMLPMEMVDVLEDIAKSRAESLLAILGLEDRMHHKPKELSGGQQQRVAIARSLANDPEIILADEPTGNLDSKTGQFVMDFLGKLNKEGKTIILITHDLNLVRYAKRIVKIKDGEIIKDTKVK